MLFTPSGDSFCTCASPLDLCPVNFSICFLCLCLISFFKCIYESRYVPSSVFGTENPAVKMLSCLQGESGGGGEESEMTTRQLLPRVMSTRQGICVLQSSGSTLGGSQLRLGAGQGQGNVSSDFTGRMEVVVVDKAEGTTSESSFSSSTKPPVFSVTPIPALLPGFIRLHLPCLPLL